MAIGRDAILGAPAHVERLEVPEWIDGNGSTTLFIKRFSARARLEIAQRYFGTPQVSPDAYAAVCGYGICDESGKALFSMPEDLPRLAELDGEVVQRVSTAILGLNKLGRDSVEDAEKNSESTPADVSPSA